MTLKEEFDTILQEIIPLQSKIHHSLEPFLTKCLEEDLVKLGLTSVEVQYIHDKLEMFHDYDMDLHCGILHKVIFHLNWWLHLGWDNLKRRAQAKPEFKQIMINDLVSQLSPEEKALLAKKLGGS